MSLMSIGLPGLLIYACLVDYGEDEHHGTVYNTFSATDSTGMLLARRLRSSDGLFIPQEVVPALELPVD